MTDDADPIAEFREAAARMVVVAEIFKAAGTIPPWARAELQSWRAPAGGATR
ncbi:MAG: hypothetical protein QOJ35_3957 [Solirubrobacteraceae bacterium]|jgi:hypothetical protein|nr:hypothetical protein [Solirubrobacteraceae bacterium]